MTTEIRLCHPSFGRFTDSQSLSPYYYNIRIPLPGSGSGRNDKKAFGGFTHFTAAAAPFLAKHCIFWRRISTGRERTRTNAAIDVSTVVHSFRFLPVMLTVIGDGFGGVRMQCLPSPP